MEMPKQVTAGFVLPGFWMSTSSGVMILKF